MIEIGMLRRVWVCLQQPAISLPPLLTLLPRRSCNASWYRSPLIDALRLVAVGPPIVGTRSEERARLRQEPQLEVGSSAKPC